MTVISPFEATVTATLPVAPDIWNAVCEDGLTIHIVFNACTEAFVVSTITAEIPLSNAYSVLSVTDVPHPSLMNGLSMPNEPIICVSPECAYFIDTSTKFASLVVT